MEHNQEENKEKQQNAENNVSEDPLVSINDIVEYMESADETADALFAAQDDNVCTYPEGYKPRQPLFSCLTCVAEPEMGGVCYGCAVNCHKDHDIVELYTKRSFKCDCGNSKFSTKCGLYEEKDARNEFNIYNHNFRGKFCECKDTFPSEHCDEEMLQCEVCEDWFHPSHISLDMTVNQEEGGSSDTNPDSLICINCVMKLPFLNEVAKSKEVVCHSKIETSSADAQSKTLLIRNMRSKLCRCDGCKKVYSRLDCEFLLDEEDDLSKFEQENKRKAEENRRTDNDNIRDLTREFGMEGAIHLLGGESHETENDGLAWRHGKRRRQS
ncbi:unnamed protein product [Caenorhabditis bovis]|uniref:UBR-type domain-containing protein n=1 Tax=Caenorhabditis bovis TaxID=2654633 RepID=A0A8S1F309_9PELO|nr:unnamed protein product [Caenorhabditis bovis]